jgi:hypothetical protein
MKRVVIPVLGLLIAIFFISCKKDAASAVASNLSLEASKTSAIKKGEPVLFELPLASSSGTINWTVKPSANTQINSSGNSASVLFGSKGTYTITAVNETTTASSSVTVKDSVYTGGDNIIPAATLSLAAGEVIKIAVSRIDTNSVAGLLFIAQTTNSYTCLSNNLITETIAGTNAYSIKYTGVNVPGGCTGSVTKASGFNFLYPISNGTITLTIEVNGISYSGTITRAGDRFTISWPDTNGVVITPTSL